MEEEEEQTEIVIIKSAMSSCEDLQLKLKRFYLYPHSSSPSIELTSETSTSEQSSGGASASSSSSDASATSKAPLNRLIKSPHNICLPQHGHVPSIGRTESGSDRRNSLAKHTECAFNEQPLLMHDSPPSPLSISVLHSTHLSSVEIISSLLPDSKAAASVVRWRLVITRPKQMIMCSGGCFSGCNEKQREREFLSELQAAQ